MKNLYIKLVLVMTITLFSANIFAYGYSAWGHVSSVELVSGGVLIWGDFSDPNNCGSSNRVFISSADAFYESSLTFAMTALASQREIRFFSSTCVKVSFHYSVPNTNQVRQGQALYIR